MAFGFRQRFGVAAVLLGTVVVGGMTSTAHAWGHQGHILISRMAALRIINDPTAPAGLKDFLKANMKYDLEACRKLAVEEAVGAEAENYHVGLDGASTWPDRVIPTKEGKKEIEPYEAPESKMHFTDLEYLTKDPSYKPDLSNRPKPADVPRDVKDPRWKNAGYVPFRVEEFYKKVVADFGKGDKVLENKTTLADVGYMAHYIEDSHQPQHSTIDYKSYSYLLGKLPQVKEVKTKGSDGVVAISYTIEGKDARKINPHGDLEFQIFENTMEPRKTYREQFWKELNSRIEKKAADAKAEGSAVGAKPLPKIAKAGSFDRTMEILSDSYEFLPAVGKAAVAGYASGEFNPQAFFTSEDTIKGEKMTIVQVIADRNASAVIEVERTLRAAWAEAHGEGK